MDIRIATPADMVRVSRLSFALGNIPLFVDHAVVALAEEDREIVGFAAAQQAMHAAGSWVRIDHRGQGLTYPLRRTLEQRLKMLGAPVYFAIPGNDFEKDLFRKYGPVTEKLVQIKAL